LIYNDVILISKPVQFYYVVYIGSLIYLVHITGHFLLLFQCTCGWPLTHLQCTQ